MIGDGAELFKLNDYDGTHDNIKSYFEVYFNSEIGF